MAQVKRSDPGFLGDPRAHPADRGYDVGGRVGGLQAELAQRLVDTGITHAVPLDARGERAMRALSIGGGYVALLAGYAAIGWAIVSLI